MDSVPYTYRLAAIALLATVVIIIDRLRHGTKGYRAGEYAVLMLAGVVGAGYGAVNDLITSTVSPEYFTLGKGLQEGPGLTLRAMVLGAKAGCPAGVVVCAIWLFWAGRTPGDHPARMRRVVGSFWIPVACAGVLAVLLPTIVGAWDPLDFKAMLRGLLPDDRVSAFRHVWWAHVGAYLGLLLGCGLGMVRMVGKPKTRQKTEGSSEPKRLSTSGMDA